ncbi:hypothetical protein KCP78_24485 [Salmonella enterica subsp. enterica]|nr:hypothetical protein KCP78_24485 [Salmonella enterica subsp. enterica]
MLEQRLHTYGIPANQAPSPQVRTLFLGTGMRHSQTRKRSAARCCLKSLPAWAGGTVLRLSVGETRWRERVVLMPGAAYGYGLAAAGRARCCLSAGRCNGQAPNIRRSFAERGETCVPQHGARRTGRQNLLTSGRDRDGAGI